MAAPLKEHICEDTDNEEVMCLSGEVYGPCFDDECGGICDPKGKCGCDCHKPKDDEDDEE